MEKEPSVERENKRVHEKRNIASNMLARSTPEARQQHACPQHTRSTPEARQHSSACTQIIIYLFLAGRWSSSVWQCNTLLEAQQLFFDCIFCHVSDVPVEQIDGQPEKS